MITVDLVITYYLQWGSSENKSKEKKQATKVLLENSKVLVNVCWKDRLYFQLNHPMFVYLQPSWMVNIPVTASIGCLTEKRSWASPLLKRSGFGKQVWSIGGGWVVVLYIGDHSWPLPTWQGELRNETHQYAVQIQSTSYFFYWICF